MNLLSVGVLSCERIAAKFLTFVPHNEKKSYGEKFSLVEGNKKFICRKLRLANFGNVSLFSSRGNKHVSELIHSVLKLPNCVLKQQPHILQLFEVLGSAFSLFEEQEQALSAYCHFYSFLIFQKTRHCTRKQCSRLLCN